MRATCCTLLVLLLASLADGFVAPTGGASTLSTPLIVSVRPHQHNGRRQLMSTTNDNRNQKGGDDNDGGGSFRTFNSRQWLSRDPEGSSRPAPSPPSAAARPSSVAPFSALRPASRITPEQRRTQEQLEIVLARMGELESRVIELEAERAALRNNPLRRVGGHLKTTAGRIVGARPLPGINRGIMPVRTLVARNISKVSRPSAMAAAATVAAENAAKGAVVATTSTLGRSAKSARRQASSNLGRGVQKAVNLSRPFYRAGVAATDIVAEYVPATSLDGADGLGAVPIPGTVLALASPQQQILYDSRRVLISCVSLGSLLGVPLGRLTRSNLVFSCLSTAFCAAYLSTLGNSVGKFVRLCGVIVLALLGKIGNYIQEQWRGFTFVYQTGKFYERLDAQLQGLNLPKFFQPDAEGRRMRGGSDVQRSPSKVVDDAAAFLKGEVARTSEATNKTLTENLQPWLANVSTAVGDWSGGVWSGVDRTLRLSKGVGALGKGISKVSEEWFESEKEAEASAKLEQWADQGVIIPFTSNFTAANFTTGNFSLEQAVEQLGNSIQLEQALVQLEDFQAQFLQGGGGGGGGGSSVEQLPEELTRSAAEEVSKALETVRVGVTAPLTPAFEQAVSQAFEQLEQFQTQPWMPEELKQAIDTVKGGVAAPLSPVYTAAAAAGEEEEAASAALVMEATGGEEEEEEERQMLEEMALDVDEMVGAADSGSSNTMPPPGEGA